MKHRPAPLALIFVMLLISACSPLANITASPDQPAASPNTTQGHFAEYPLPQNHSGIMRPAVDGEGRVWFGEMGHNFLTCFQPATHTFEQITPPHGANGLMGIAVASDNTIWFAEQYANYIGHYHPTTHTFQTYPLPFLHKSNPATKDQTTLPSAPNDLVLDKEGNVWFTEMNADAIGMLNVHTGHFTHYPISSPATIQVLNPYGITIDPQGAIWFTEASTTHLSRLDPATGKIQTYSSAKISGPLMEVLSDEQGQIWATTFNSGLLLKFLPSNAQFTPYLATSNGSDAGSIYGLTFTPDHQLWLALTSANAIAHFDIASTQFTYYPIPTADSSPLGIASDRQHTLWFTESSANQIASFTR